MMATWFLSSAWAQYVGGIIAGLTETETIAGAALSNEAALNTSLEVFTMLGWVGVGIGVALAGLSFFLKGMAHGAFEEKPELAMQEITPSPTEGGRAAERT
jgi:POT family proton-dependent oligopeptide transporter